jgi:hypothetical protein
MDNEVTFTTTEPKSYILSDWGMLTKPVLIFVSGKAGTGKDTIALLLQEELKNIINAFIIRRYYFATGAKDIAFRIGWDGKKDNKGRKLLQDIGDVGRNYNPDTWATLSYKEFTREVISIDFVLFPDWRHPNELEFFRCLSDFGNIFTIKINAPNREVLLGTEFYIHKSETALDNYKTFDYIIDNSGDLGNTRGQCQIISEKIIKSLGGN